MTTYLIYLTTFVQHIKNSINQTQHAWQLSNLALALLFATGLFLCLSLILLGIILIRRTYLPYKTVQNQAIIEEVENYLVEYLHGSFEKRAQIATILGKYAQMTISFKCQCLKEQIILIHKNLEGQEAKALQDLYKNLGFYQRSVDKIKSLNAHICHEGLTELVNIKLCQNIPNIVHLTTHKNRAIRFEALNALILEGENWTILLAQSKHPLSKEAAEKV
jgi:hypothetical protein